MSNKRPALLAFTFAAAAAAFAACGGGGSSSGTPAAPPAALTSSPPASQSSSAPSTKPSSAPSSAPSSPPTVAAATPAPEIDSTATIAGRGVAGGTVAFSCGCTAQAGTGIVNASGSYVLTATSPAQPASPNPTYTMAPGRNYVEIVTASNGAQVWNMHSLGTIPSRNHALNATGNGDRLTTAVSLYAFYFAQTNGSSDTSFDLWSFPTLQTWLSQLATTTNPADLQLLADIDQFQQTSPGSLYPSAPTWNGAVTVNPTIAGDLLSVQSNDPGAPTACAIGAPCPNPTP